MGKLWRPAEQESLSDTWLMRRVRQRYEHPAEVTAYSDQVAEGLRPEEEAALARWCPHPCRVLDLGCGAGREALVLARRGYQLVGADISQGMIAQAQRMAAAAGLEIAFVWMPDPLRLPVPSAAFDGVLGLAQLLAQVPGRLARVALLREIERVMAPDGLYLGTVADRRAAADLCGDTAEEMKDLEKVAGLEEGDIWVWQPSEARLEDALIFHLHTPGEISWELRQAGLRLVDCRMGSELAPAGSADAYRYRFIVAKRAGSRSNGHRRQEGRQSSANIRQ